MTNLIRCDVQRDGDQWFAVPFYKLDNGSVVSVPPNSGYETKSLAKAEAKAIIKKDRRLLTTLNYSAGVQSTRLLWGYLLGEFPIPENFVVLNADPGMEKEKSYEHTEKMRSLCTEKGIEFVTAPGPNLYKDILDASSGLKKRIDNPPYFTIGQKGKRGQLAQCCTREYKIRPMEREIRRQLEKRHGISIKSGYIPGYVETIIGFAADEQHRVKQDDKSYIRFRYPLIESGEGHFEIIEWYRGKNPTGKPIEIPPRSLCNGCFAHGLQSLKKMKADSSNDFQQALDVDRALRKGLPGVKQQLFMNDTLKTLDELSAVDFDLGDVIKNDMHRCDSGVCFL